MTHLFRNAGLVAGSVAGGFAGTYFTASRQNQFCSKSSYGSANFELNKFNDFFQSSTMLESQQMAELLLVSYGVGVILGSSCGYMAGYALDVASDMITGVSSNIAASVQSSCISIGNRFK